MSENHDLIIFDGSNFFHYAKKLSPNTHLTEFNYRKIAETICENNNCAIEYCVGEIKQEKGNLKSKRLYSQQQTLFYNLSKQNIKVEKGYMLKSNGIYREKGTDVRIALNILKGAIKNQYQTCYVISSDTDLIPAIADAKKEGKRIVYVGFTNAISKALRANCSETILITKKMIKSSEIIKEGNEK